MIGEERYPAYGRPLISYYLLGATDRAHMNYRPADFYEKNGVALKTGVRAEKIDPAKKTVSLSDGRRRCIRKTADSDGFAPLSSRPWRA